MVKTTRRLEDNRLEYVFGTRVKDRHVYVVDIDSGLTNDTFRLVEYSG